MNRYKFIQLTITFILVTLIAMLLLLASVPPTSRDALTHHLAVPKLYLQHGGIYEIPWLIFSYYPMNLDLLYMIPLAFGNDIIPKYLHFSFAFGIAVLIFFYLKSRINSVIGLLGALFFLSIPVIVKLSTTVYVDLGLIFFSTASFLLLFRWVRRNYKLSILICSGIFCGLAVGTKYNGLIYCLLTTLFIPFLYIRSHPEISKGSELNQRAFLFALLYFSVTFIVFSPWMVRNILWTNNPLYPLFQNYLSNSGSPLQNSEITSLTIRKLVYNESPIQVILLPLRMFFEGKDNVPQFFDGQLSPFLLLLPPLAFLHKSNQNNDEQFEKITMVLFSILFFFLAIFLTGARARYISPVLPFLVILSFYGLRNVFFSLKRLPFTHSNILSLVIPCLVLIIALSFNFIYISEQFRIYQPLSYLNGSVSRDDYISRFRDEYPLILFANQHLPVNSKTLCVFLGDRGYYMDFHHIFATPTSRDDLVDLLYSRDHSHNSSTAYTHLLVRDDITSYWIKNLDTLKSARTVLFFSNNLSLLYKQNGYTLYKITNHMRPVSETKREEGAPIRTTR